MKELIPLVAVILSFSLCLAQTGLAKRGGESPASGNVPPAAKTEPCTDERVDAFFDKLMARLPPDAVTQVRRLAQSPRMRGLAQTSPSGPGVLRQVRRAVANEVRALKLDISDADIEAVAHLVMIRAAEKVREDLKGTMEDVKEINKVKEGMRKHANELRKDACGFIDEKKKADDKGGRPQ